MMALVAGMDSSTQSCKVVIRDADTGAVVRHGRAAHPDGTEVHPDAWWAALSEAIAEAGGIDDVAAISVGLSSTAWCASTRTTPEVRRAYADARDLIVDRA